MSRFFYLNNIIGAVKKNIKEHYFICVMALLMTLLVSAPVIVFPLLNSGIYKGINIAHFGTDEHYYLSRAKEVLDGHGMGNVVLREGKDGQDPILNYSERILLSPFRLLGLADKVNVVDIYNIYNFIGVFVLILLIYALVFELSKDKMLSVITSLFVIGGYSIVYNKTLFFTDFNIYGRAMYPYVSSLAFFLYLNFLVRSLNSAGRKFQILAGLSFGLLFYIYFYAWTFALAMNGILLLLLVFKKDFLNAKNIFIISSIGILIGSYNLYRMYDFFSSSAGRQTSYFFWTLYSHQPIFSSLGFSALILFLIFTLKRRDDRNSIIFLAFILAGWIAQNQQVITGRVVQYSHYYWFFFVPLAIISGLYMIWSLIGRENYRKAFLSILLVTVFLNTAVGQYRSYPTKVELKKYEQNFSSIIDYLNKIPESGVILAASNPNGYLFTIYTKHDLFWNNSATFFSTPLQRMKDVLYVYLYLNRNSRNDFGGYINSMMSTKGDSFYRQIYEDIEGYLSGYDYYIYQKKAYDNDSSLNSLRRETVSALSEEYKKTAGDGDKIKILLKKYGVSYIVWDKNLYPEWDLSGIKGLTEVLLNNNIRLYRLDY